METPRAARVQAVASLEAWFREHINRAIQRHGLTAAEQTEHYIVHLASGFARSENLYADSEGRRGPRPLALLLADALHSETREGRDRGLQRLGDVALFVSGFFSDSLALRSVDVDYYVRMGGTAYGTLSDSPSRSIRQQALVDVFRELAENFVDFVDVLNEVADQSRIFDEKDVMRLYEVWIRTGSRRAREKLEGLGVVPTRSARTDFTH